MKLWEHRGRSRAVAASCAGISVALVLSACSGAGGGAAADDADIVVGAQLAVTGSSSESGKPQVSGMEARFEEANAAGGIGGHDVVLKVGDDQYDPAKSPGVARQLVESDHAVALLGAGSAPAYAVLPYLASKQVLGISGGGSSVLIDEPNTTYRNTVPSYDRLAAAVTEYAVSRLHMTKIAVAYTSDSVGEPILNGARAQLATHGLEPVAEVSYSATATSAAAQAAKLKESGAEFVVLFHIAAVASVILKANEKIGYQPTYGSLFALANPALIDVMGDVLDNRIYFASHQPLVGSEDLARMEAACEKYSCDPANSNTITGYMAADAIVNVLEKAVKDNGGKAPTPAQVLAATDGFSLDNDVNKGIEWTSDNFSGGNEAQILVEKDGTFVQAAPFAELPDVS